MLVTCLPGVDRRNLRSTLRDQLAKVGNLRSGSSDGDAFTWLLSYLDWAAEAARVLGTQISSTDIERLVLTPRYHALLPWATRSFTSQVWPVLNGLLSVELGQRTAAFEDAVKALDRQIERWSIAGGFYVLDTSVYIEHEQKLEELDFALMLNAHQRDVHILVPIAVVDELDTLKQSKDRTARWRALYTLAVLDRLFTDPTDQTWIRKQDAEGVPRDEPTIELVFDPPGHLRLPISDDEIVDRAVAIMPLAAREVAFVTYDTGQSMRARAAGLRVVKLTRPIGEEPE